MAKRTYLIDNRVTRETRPETGRKEVKDVEPGLSLRITPSGVKSWSVVYRLQDGDGKRTVKKRKTVGYHPTMSVAQARAAARKITELARAGIDPEAQAAEEAATKHREDIKASRDTFGAVAEEWCRAMEAGKLTGSRDRPVTPETAAGRRSLLERQVLCDLGKLNLRKISNDDVSATLDRIERENGPVDNALKVIRGVFQYAAGRGQFSVVPPTTGIKKRQPKSKEVRAATDDQLHLIWATAQRMGWPYGSVVQMLMLSGQRRREIAFLRWSEVDWSRRLLIIPSERVKNRAGAHEVPITPPMEAILRDAEARCAALQRATDDAHETAAAAPDLVFPSAVTGGPLAGWHRLKDLFDRAMQAQLAALNDDERRAVRAGGKLRDETKALKADALAKIGRVKIEPWTLHGLRHTLVTRLLAGDENEAGEIIWSPRIEFVQAVVNHEITMGVTKTYDQSDLQRRYRHQKRELLEWWARKLMAIVGEAEAQENAALNPLQES